jgi:hypothetical protein
VEFPGYVPFLFLFHPSGGLKSGETNCLKTNDTEGGLKIGKKEVVASK